MSLLIFNLLSKNGIELLGHVIIFVRDLLASKLQDEVGVCLAVDVHGMEVISLHDVDPDQHPDWLVGWKSLEESVFQISPHTNIIIIRVCW